MINKILRTKELWDRLSQVRKNTQSGPRPEKMNRYLICGIFFLLFIAEEVETTLISVHRICSFKYFKAHTSFTMKHDTKSCWLGCLREWGLKREGQRPLLCSTVPADKGQVWGLLVTQQSTIWFLFRVVKAQWPAGTPRHPPFSSKSKPRPCPLLYKLTPLHHHFWTDETVYVPQKHAYYPLLHDPLLMHFSDKSL